MKKELLIGLNKRLNSSSLIEVIVSIVIISIVFYLAIGIFGKLNGSQNSLFKVKSHLTLDKLLNDLIQEKAFFNHNGTYDSFNYSIEITEMRQTMTIHIKLNSITSDQAAEDRYIIDKSLYEIE